MEDRAVVSWVVLRRRVGLCVVRGRGGDSLIPRLSSDLTPGLPSQEARRLSRHELGKRDIGAGEGACAAGLGQLHHSGEPAVHSEGQSQDGRVAASEISVGLAAGEKIRRGEVRDHQAAPRAQDLGDGRSAFERHVRAGAHVACGSRGPVVRDDVDGVVAGDDGEKARGDPDALGGHLGQRRKRSAQALEVRRGPV